MKALIGFKAFYFFGSVSVRFRFGFGVYVKWPLNKMASAVNFRTSLRYNRTQRFREQKYQRNHPSGRQRFLYNITRASFEIF